MTVSLALSGPGVGDAVRILGAIDGERLTDNQVINFANLLLVAGHITTTLLLGNAVLTLGLHPDQAKAVREDRSKGARRDRGDRPDPLAVPGGRPCHHRGHRDRRAARAG